MDVVKIIDAAIERLPTGDFSPGLKAVKRHIVAAIRHFERDDDGDQDSFTDAIYRCNQAFEGGLKEAYRVLAGKDPSKLTPHQIEAYLEENKLIRPRALKQLTRYREDYRNPSTHDYKLDFDEDEALLAIVAVCAFAKLLINQIAGKLAFNAGSEAAGDAAVQKYRDPRAFVEYVSQTIVEALPKLPDPQNADGNTVNLFIDGVLSGKGIETDLILDNEGEDEDNPWDNLISHSGFSVPIEVRVTREANITYTLEWIRNRISRIHANCVVLVIFDGKNVDSYSKHVKRVEENSFIYSIIPNGQVKTSKREDLDVIEALRQA